MKRFALALACAAAGAAAWAAVMEPSGRSAALWRGWSASDRAQNALTADEDQVRGFERP